MNFFALTGSLIDLRS